MYMSHNSEWEADAKVVYYIISVYYVLLLLYSAKMYIIIVSVKMGCAGVVIERGKWMRRMRKRPTSARRWNVDSGRRKPLIRRYT